MCGIKCSATPHLIYYTFKHCADYNGIIQFNVQKKAMNSKY